MALAAKLQVRAKDHKAPVLRVFTAVESDMLRNVLHIKGWMLLM
jgi:hypothetical protein